MERVKFTQMKYGSKEDYLLLNKYEKKFVEGTADRILRTMQGLTSGLVGYQINRLEHSLQTATRALKENASDEMIRSYKKVVGEYHIVDKLHRRDDNPRTRKLMDRELMNKMEQEELNNKLDEIIDEFTDIHDDDVKKKTIH